MLSLSPDSVAPSAVTPFVPFSMPWIGQEEIDAVLDCLRSGWLTTGPRVNQFETEFASALNVRHAVAVNSCTAALHLALEALGIRRGDEVLVPTMTFAATAEVVLYLGAKPVLLDCRWDTLNIDEKEVVRYLDENCHPGRDGWYNRKTGARVMAVIPVHYGGLPCNMAEITALAKHFQMAVVEDCAHAFPARTANGVAGTLGDVGAFSFYANKNITTGEGGMLITSDDAVADRARLMRLHGMSRDAWKRYMTTGSWFYEVMEAGFKYNLTDLAASLGVVQLRRSDELWRRRQHIAECYLRGFVDLPEIQTPAPPICGYEHAWHLFPIRIRPELLRIGRNAFMVELKDRSIGTSVHFIPLHTHPLYRDRFGYCPDDLPVALRAYERLISLPIYPRMSDGDVDRVIDAVREIVKENRR